MSRYLCRSKAKWFGRFGEFGDRDKLVTFTFFGPFALGGGNLIRAAIPKQIICETQEPNRGAGRRARHCAPRWGNLLLPASMAGRAARAAVRQSSNYEVGPPLLGQRTVRNLKRGSSDSRCKHQGIQVRYLGERVRYSPGGYAPNEIAPTLLTAAGLEESPEGVYADACDGACACARRGKGPAPAFRRRLSRWKAFRERPFALADPDQRPCRPAASVPRGSARI